MGASGPIRSQPQPCRIDDCYEEYAISEADAAAMREAALPLAELSAIALPGALDDVE